MVKNLTFNNGSSQIPLQTVAAGVFNKIKMQVWAVYHTVQSGTTSFNHRMDESYTVSRKVKSFYTQVNDRRVQSTLVDTATYDDWSIMAPLLKNSVIALTSATYRKYWIWAELYGIHDFVTSINSDELQGFDNKKSDYQYTVQATTNDRPNLWVMCIIGQRIISYDANGRLVIQV